MSASCHPYPWQHITIATHYHIVDAFIFGSDISLMVSHNLTRYVILNLGKVIIPV